MLKYAVCNELFGNTGFDRTCEITAKAGFHGIEIAPFTLFGDVTKINPETVKSTRKALADNGLEFAGLHWLFVKPENLHITSSDKRVRERSWDHLRRLLELAGELGGGNLILGSPKQREAAGISTAEALKYMEEGLASTADTAGNTGSTVCIEALASKDTNVVNTLEESLSMIKKIDREGISGMFDFHNCGDETLAWKDLIRNYSEIIKHIHLNTPEGGHPAPDDVPMYTEAFRAIQETGYSGWISLEIFTVPENPETVLNDTAGFLKKVSLDLG